MASLIKSRWFSLVRIWVPWLAPRHGKDSFQLDKDAMFCSFLSPEGRHMALLAISGVNDVQSIFRSTESGEVTVHVPILAPPPIAHSLIM